MDDDMKKSRAEFYDSYVTAMYELHETYTDFVHLPLVITSRALPIGLWTCRLSLSTLLDAHIERSFSS
jgi:hypothetical protein